MKKKRVAEERMSGLPKKYKEALALLDAKDEFGFIKFAEDGKLAYDVSNVSGFVSKDRTLFEAAVCRELWDCVEFMVSRSAPTYEDLAHSYGYTPSGLSEKIWQAFVAANEGTVPLTVQESEHRRGQIPLIEAAAKAFCHCSLIKRLISVGQKPNCTIETRHGQRLPLALYSLCADIFSSFYWSPETFDWLVSTFTLKQLGIDDDDINQLLYNWASQGTNIAENCFDDCDPVKANAAERIFWKLEALHADKKQFAKIASKIKPYDVVRFSKILACIGVMTGAPAEDVAAEMPCTHCHGTGKIIAVDPNLAQEAKKRRIEQISAASTQ